MGDGYKWEQTGEDVTLLVRVPAGTRARDVAVDIHTQSVAVSCGGNPPLVEGALEGAVDVDGSSWSMEDGVVEVTLEKRSPGARWSAAIVGHGDLVKGRVTSAADAEAFATLEQEVADLERKMGELDGGAATAAAAAEGVAAPAEAAAEEAKAIDAPPPSAITGTGRLCPRQASAPPPAPDAALPLLPSTRALTAEWAQASLGTRCTRVVEAVEIIDGPARGTAAASPSAAAAQIRFEYGEPLGTDGAALEGSVHVGGEEQTASDALDSSDALQCNPASCWVKLSSRPGGGACVLSAVPRTAESGRGGARECACFEHFFHAEPLVPLAYALRCEDSTAASVAVFENLGAWVAGAHTLRSAANVLRGIAQLHGRAATHAMTIESEWLPPLQFTEDAPALLAAVASHSGTLLRTAAAAAAAAAEAAAASPAPVLEDSEGGGREEEPLRNFAALGAQLARDDCAALKSSLLALATTPSPTLVHGALYAEHIALRRNALSQEHLQQARVAGEEAGEELGKAFAQDAQAAAAELAQLATRAGEPIAPPTSEGVAEGSDSTDDEATIFVGWSNVSWGCGLFDMAVFLAAQPTELQQKLLPNLLRNYCEERKASGLAEAEARAKQQVHGLEKEPVSGAALGTELGIEQAEAEWKQCLAMLFATLCCSAETHASRPDYADQIFRAAHFISAALCKL